MASKFAVFDIDGTLIRWQLYHAIVNELARENLLGVGSRAKLQALRMRWKQREHVNAFRTYESGLIKIYEKALVKLDPQKFDLAVDRVINEYKSQVYTYTRDLIAELKNQNYTLLAISGSHQEIVARIAEIYGFDDYIGTAYERIDNQFTGNKFIASLDKKVSLDRLIIKHQLQTKDSIAVGDSKGDIAMLEMVDKAIAFNPDQELLMRAKESGWKIVIERKNVIYELEEHNGSYILA
jgi:HAD superfamily hydrolase (TIGR01490 family)